MQVSFWKRYDKFHILLHVLAWLGFLSLPALFIGNGGIGILDMSQRWEFWYFGLCFIVPYYLNGYLWMPYVIRRKQYVVYIIPIVLIGLGYAFWLRPFERLMQLDAPPKKETVARRPVPPSVRGDNRPFPLHSQDHRSGLPPKRTGRMDIASVYIVALVILLGSLFRIVQYWIQSQQKVQQVQHEWTKAELAFLKAQVHPHFLFNTLNNIYSLALTNDLSTATCDQRWQHYHQCSG